MKIKKPAKGTRARKIARKTTKKRHSKVAKKATSFRYTPKLRLGHLDKELIARHECGPAKFSGEDDALFEEHLIFDHVIEPEEAQPRGQFEALARSLRDVLAQRWVKTRRIPSARRTHRAQILERSDHTGVR